MDNAGELPNGNIIKT